MCEVDQDWVYYYYVVGQEIVLCDWDDFLIFQVGGFIFYGGCLNGICEKLLYLKILGVIVLYLNLVFIVLSVYKYDMEDYCYVDL